MELALTESLKDRDGRLMVLRMDNERYYDATAMAVSCEKRLDKYWASKSTLDVMSAIGHAQGVQVDDLKRVVVTGPVELRGTWIHEDLALHLATWLSPDFFAFVLKTFRRFINGEITTEESKAAKQTYEQAQKQLQSTQRELAISESQRKVAEAGQKKFWRQVDQATAEVDDLKKQLGLKRQTAVKRKRVLDGKHFLQELSRAIQEYRDGVSESWPEVEERLEMSVSAFLDYLSSRSSHGWVGKDLSMFGELPTRKGNPKQWNLLLWDGERAKCRYDSIVPARNHESKAKLWQAPADHDEV